MGILSFFEQIGNLIYSMIEYLIYTIRGIFDLIGMLLVGVQFIYNDFLRCIPGEVSIAFSLLISVSVLYLVVNR